MFCVVRLAAEPLTPTELAAVKAAESARIGVIRQVYGAVVAVYGKSRQGGGSGVLIDPEGYALTNFHVVAGCGEEGFGGLADGKLYPWKLIGVDPGGDLALIKLAGKETFPFAPLGNSDTVRVGDFAMAMGNPFVLAEDQTPTVTLGIVSGVGRYQPGSGGKNVLEYASCIQIDSSINPGNSGGPLFNMKGQVIGINGRGSFEERGRVNVGVGYAISMEQCKHFLPDLLASKFCMHGTLEATFRDYEAGVICDQIRIDSPLHKAGMELGDRLIAFDGQPVRSANHYKNLVTPLPANWPVEVKFEHRGKAQTVWVRLTPNPYPKPPQPATQPATRPATQPATRPATQPATRPARPPGTQPGRIPIPMTMPARPGIKGEPGKLRDEKLNREACVRIFRQWTEFAGGRAAYAKLKAFRTETEIRVGGNVVAQAKTLEAADGRFRFTDDKGLGASWDGRVFWRRLPGPDGAPREERFEGDEARKQREVALPLLLNDLLEPNAVDRVRRLVLEGGDYALGQRAYRLRVEDRHGLQWLLWFSVFGPDGQPQTRLLKVGNPGPDYLDGSGQTFEEYRPVRGVMVGHRTRTVRGLGEETLSEHVITRGEAVEELPADAFTAPPGPDGTQPAR